MDESDGLKIEEDEDKVDVEEPLNDDDEVDGCWDDDVEVVGCWESILNFLG